MKVYTLACTSDDGARDIARSGDLEDFSPYSVHLSRELAEAEIVKETNLERSEEREFEDDGKLPGFTDFPDVTLEDFASRECNTYEDRTLRWKYMLRDDEGDADGYGQVWVVVELELDAD